MIALLLSLGCVDRPEPRAALEGSEFRFCEVPVRIGDDQEAWCRFVADLPEERCPGVHELCAGGEGAERESGCDRGDDPDDEASDPYMASPPVMFRWSSAATEELLRWTAAFFVALLVLGLLRAFWLTFGTAGRRRREEEAETPEPSTAPDDDVDDALPDVPALDSGSLIDHAQAAFARGEWGAAAWLARGAALKHLHRRERLKLHRSKTDREYLRAVSDDPAVAEDLRAVVGAAERHRWGAQPVGLDDASDALAAARRLLAVTAALLLVLLASPSAARADRFGPTGDAGLARVLALYGHDAGYRLVSLDQLDDRTDALFLDLTELAPSEEQWEGVREWVAAGGVLVAAGDVTVGFEDFGGLVAIEPDPTLIARSPLVGSQTPLPRWPDGPQYGFTLGQPWISVEDGTERKLAAVSEVTWGSGVVVGIGDARLFDNLAFVDPDNEAFVGDLLYIGQAHLGWPLPTPARVQVVTPSALSSDMPDNNPFTSVANARMLPFVLQLLATWVLLSLWRGWPLARARVPTARERLSFGEHVTALGTRWFRLGASGHALREVAALWLQRLGSSGLVLAARRAGYTAAEADAFAERVAAAAETPDPEPAAGDLELMEEIWTITRRPT